MVRISRHWRDISLLKIAIFRPVILLGESSWFDLLVVCQSTLLNAVSRVVSGHIIEIRGVVVPPCRGMSVVVDILICFLHQYRLILKKRVVNSRVLISRLNRVLLLLHLGLVPQIRRNVHHIFNVFLGDGLYLL